MSDEKKTPKKKAKKKAAKPTVKLACTVIKPQTQIGSMILAKGKKLAISEEKAEALEKLGKVRIDGVA